MTKLVYVFLLLLLTGKVFSQNPVIIVNSIAADNSCMPVHTVQGNMDTIQGKWVGIYHAEIVGDCLELSIMYGGCKAEMEFVTDDVLLTSQSYRMIFLLKYMTAATNPCKDTMKTKLSFDLLPFKNKAPGKVVFISLKGSVFNLGYRQMQ
ncbi:MAG: hypothetical protein V4506_09135 [Bacteroidota bacterium]